MFTESLGLYLLSSNPSGVPFKIAPQASSSDVRHALVLVPFNKVFFCHWIESMVKSPQFSLIKPIE